jgi:hypothetical protein
VWRNGDVCGVLNVDIDPETCTNEASNPQQSFNFDKEVFLEEVRKYR